MKNMYLASEELQNCRTTSYNLKSILTSPIKFEYYDYYECLYVGFLVYLNFKFMVIGMKISQFIKSYQLS